MYTFNIYIKYIYINIHYISDLEKPSSEPNHPDYVPSIFPTKNIDTIKISEKMNRYNSFKKR